MNDNKSYHIRFVRLHTSFPFSTYDYCGKIDHISYTSNVRKNAYIGVKKVWIPKGATLGILLVVTPSIWLEKKNQFSKLELKNSGYVTFGDNSKGKIIGKGEVGKEP